MGRKESEAVESAWWAFLIVALSAEVIPSGSGTCAPWRECASSAGLLTATKEQEIKRPSMPILPLRLETALPPKLAIQRRACPHLRVTAQGGGGARVSDEVEDEN